MSARRLLLLGPPGAGKGTQAQRLGGAARHPADLDGRHAARRASPPAARSAAKAKAYMDAGELVPDAIVIGVAEERLAKPDAQRGFILDGFPRTAAQAEALDACSAKLGRRSSAASRSDEDELVKRLLARRDRGPLRRQRGDDPEAPLRVPGETEPLIAYYRQARAAARDRRLGSSTRSAHRGGARVTAAHPIKPGAAGRCAGGRHVAEVLSTARGVRHHHGLDGCQRRSPGVSSLFKVRSGLRRPRLVNDEMCTASRRVVGGIVDFGARWGHGTGGDGRGRRGRRRCCESRGSRWTTRWR